MADNNDIRCGLHSGTDQLQFQEAGEHVGRAINAETLDFTGKIQFNFKEGRLLNWNVEQTGWPKKKTKLET